MNRAERVREVIRAEDRVPDLPRAPLAPRRLGTKKSARCEKIRSPMYTLLNPEAVILLLNDLNHCEEPPDPAMMCGVE
jgi:hypothetical protein